ncbi:CHAT domain-containing protein [Nostoc sp. FACHB-973]|nr:CHAT domain-containing protein [Nostoc sp. FACHB-973]
MNSPSSQAQLELILQLLSCPSGQEPELLAANITLVNTDLVEMMQQMAGDLPQQPSKKDAEWLVNLARKLEEFLSLGSQEFTGSTDSSNWTDRHQFFMQVLEAIIESRGNLPGIYPLIEHHLHLVDINWIVLLQNWKASIIQQNKIDKDDSDRAEIVAAVLYNMGNLFLEFPQGSLSLNLEIAIASYKLALDIYRQLGLQQNLFQTLTNLGSVYSKKAETGIYPPANLQAIECYIEASQILRALGLPESLSLTLTNLGIAYCDRADFGIDPATNLEQAIAAHLEALEIRRQLGLSLDLSVTFTNLGNAYLAQAELGIEPGNNLKKTIDAYLECIDIRRKLKLEKILSAPLTNLGNAYRTQAQMGIEPVINLQRAIATYQEAVSILRQHRQERDLSTVLNSLANTYRTQAELGIEPVLNLQRAIATYTEATQILSQSELQRDLCQTLNNLGIAYRTQANLGIDPVINLKKAIRTYREAAQILRKLGIQRDLSATLNNLGIAYRTQAELGIEPAANLQWAIDTYTEAAEIFQELKLERELSHTLNNLGGAYYMKAELGMEAAANLQQAIATYIKAVAIRRQPGWERDLSQTLNNLGTAYLTQAQLQIDPVINLQRAIDTYTEAAQILQPDMEWELSTILDNLGTTYRTHAQQQIQSDINLQRAIAAYTQAVQIRRRAGFERGLSQTLNNLATAYRTQVELGIDADVNRQSAVMAYREALQTFDPQVLPVDCLRTGRNLGNFALSQEWWEIAIAGYAPAIDAVEQTRFSSLSESRKKEVTEGALQVYRNIVQTYIQLQQYDKALEYVDRSKTRNLVELLTTRDLTPKGDIPPDTLQHLQTLRQELLIAERCLNPDLERLNTLRQELDTYIQTYIQPIDPSFSLTQKVNPINFATMRETLPDDRSALVAWYVMGDRILTFIVTRQTDLPHLIELAKESRQALIELANQYLNCYTEDKTVWKTRLPDFLQEIATLLNLSAVLQYIPDTCDRLILVPHLFLHLLPLHALPMEEEPGKSYLLDRFPRGLHYAPSIQLLQLSQTWSRPSFQRFFGVQNPTEDLSFTDLEVATIRTSFHPDDDVLERHQAQKTSLTRERLAQTNIAHFACHGYFNLETPSQSALLLAESNTIATTSSNDQTRFWASRDGGEIDLEKCLTLGDIFALDLRQCRLTTLSACETGLTDFKSLSDEYIGLPSGFLYAGSPSVVSSLWTVNDLSTAFLMIEFYKNLQNRDRYPSVAIALNQAQIWLRNLTTKELKIWIAQNKLILNPTLKMNLNRQLQKMPDLAQPFASPFYWAAFCAIGQ